MENNTMGEIIGRLRRERGMTQKELADMLNITDKAISKWERGLACPDTMTIPKIAEIFGISIEELMNAKAAPAASRRGTGDIIGVIPKAITIAMGVAAAVTSVLGELDTGSGLTMLGIGLACAGISLLRSNP